MGKISKLIQNLKFSALDLVFNNCYSLSRRGGRKGRGGRGGRGGRKFKLTKN
jgi:hypothetical protein